MQLASIVTDRIPSSFSLQFIHRYSPCCTEHGVPVGASARTRPGIRMIRLCMRLKLREGDAIQYITMRGSQDHRWGNTIPMGFLPSIGTQAPAVARSQSRESVQRTGGGQIVAPTARKVQKCSGHLGADPVPAMIGRRHATIPVTQKTSQRLQAACFKGFVEYIFLFAGHHSPPFCSFKPLKRYDSFTRCCLKFDRVNITLP